ncbi:MAG: hypothetical protein JWN67_1792 [Actinomycetia bacterium]|nr:hypothetical protein [Actinomycetes bacterium]
MRRVAALLAVGLVALLLTGCGPGKDSDTYVLEVQGAADVKAPEVQHLGAGRHRLQVGQTVTVTGGSAVLGLPGDTSLELRRGSTVEVGPRPTLVDGDALAVAGSGDDLTVAAGDATFDLHDGAARVRRSAGVTFAVYQGGADVESLGRRRTAKALRQVTVTDSGSLQKAVPLVYDRADPDPWDTRYLNDAIDLGGQLDRRVRLLNTRPTPPAWDAGYLEGIVPALRSAKGFDAGLLVAGRSVGETIVGASIALGGSGDLADRWQHAFAFREEGADWGLVALDQRARRASVLNVLNGVLDRVVASISPISTGGSGGPSTTSTGGRASTTTTTTPRRGTTPTAPTAPATPILPPITVPILPSSPTPTTPPPTTPTQPSSPPTTPSTPKPTIPPVTVPPPVQGLLDGLLGNGGGQSTPGLGGLLNAISHLLDGS